MIKHEPNCTISTCSAYPNDKCDCKFKKFNELEALAKPLQDWMLDNHDPMCKVEIDREGVRIWTIKMDNPMLEKGL